MSESKVKFETNLKSPITEHHATESGAMPLTEDKKDVPEMLSSQEKRNDVVVEVVDGEPKGKTAGNTTPFGDPSTSIKAHPDANTTLASASPLGNTLDTGAASSSRTRSYSTPQLPTPSPPRSIDSSRALRRYNAVIFTWKHLDKDEMDGILSRAGSVGGPVPATKSSKARKWSEREAQPESDAQSDKQSVLPSSKLRREYQGSDEELVDPPFKRYKSNRVTGRKNAKCASRISHHHTTSLPTPPSTPQARRLRPRKQRLDSA